MKKKFAVSITIGGKDKLSKSVRKGTSSLGKMKLMAKATGRSLRKLGAGALRVGRAMGRMAKTGFLAVAGAVTATVLAVNKVAESMDTLAKTARSINFPIEEFQEWRFVAEQSGVKTAVFDKSIQKFTRSIGEMKGGYGSLYTALNKSNKPLLAQLKNTDNVSDALNIYLKAIGQTSEATGKAALSAAGFGRAGIDMINIANESSEAIGRLREQARENGVVTAKQAKAAEDYNDMQNRLKLTLKSLAVDALAPLMPKMTKLTDGFRKWLLINRKIIQQGVSKVFDAISDGAKNAIKWISKNKGEIKKFGSQVLGFGKTLLTITKWAFKNRTAVLGIVAAIGAIKVTMGIVSLISSLKSIASLTGAAGAAGAASSGGVVVNATKQINSLSTALGKAGLVGAAGAAGVAIGLLITKLINNSQDKSLRKANVSALESRGISKMTDSELNSFMAKQQKTLKGASGFGSNLSDIFSGRDENKNLRDNAVMAMQSILEEKRMRADRNAKTANMTSRSMAFTASEPDFMQQMMSDTRPGVTMSQPQETVKTERVELVIKDEAGKAEVTTNTASGHLAINHTGGK
jgi:hypothetical protein